MKRAVITGPTGVIGTALTKKLALSGTEVFAVCRKNSTRINTIIDSPKINIVKCDLNELETLTEKIGVQCDAFFHLAWEGTLDPKNRFDMYLQNKNVKYALDAAKIAGRLGCNVFVGAGSQAEYGVKTDILRPDTFPEPISGYGMAKLCAGQMTRYICQSNGIRHIWPRILSVYGVGDGNQTFISSAIIKMLSGEKFSMTPGDQIWDYLYSDDAADALIAMAEQGKDGAVYVLGSGKTMHLKDYVTIIRDLINPNLDIGFGNIPYNKDQVMHMEADISSLISDTGWTANTDFRNGVAVLIDKIKERM